MEAKRCYGCMNLKRGSPVCEYCGYDERCQNAPHQLPVGTVLQGHYAVGRVLGQGGFGITYLGLDTTLDIPVAIKEYYPSGMVSRESSVNHGVSLSVADSAAQFAENRDRFLREARILARLESVPEVVQIKNFFTENNTAYIVMGYVRGITLKEHLRRCGGRLPAGEVFRLFKPLLRALDQVHKAGLVHRDISPDNIMLTPEGQVRLIDFGAAHAATIAGDKSTQAVLKHGFAPPEQYQRKGQLGPWTDIYAICATIYCCITGLMPPTATDRMLGEEDFRWDALTGLTAAQCAALQQGLSIQYRPRIQTMEELSSRLFPEAHPAPVFRPTEPEVSETGTITLGKGIELPPFTAPVDRTAPAIPNYTAPVEPIYTAPVDSPATAPVQPEKKLEYRDPTILKPKDAYLGPAAPKAEQPEPPKEPEKQPLMQKFMYLIAAAVFAVMILGYVSTNTGWKPTVAVPESHTEQETIPTTVATVPTTVETVPTGSRVLMEYENDRWGEAAFRTDISRLYIDSITFLDSTQSAPEDAVDASRDFDGSVLAWIVKENGNNDLYLAAEGKIILPQNCGYLFYHFTNIEYLDCANLDFSNVVNMDHMFSYCLFLESLDLSECNLENVKDMSYMFDNCLSLKSVNLSGLNTENVENMSYMFRWCQYLETLDLSEIDTGNVTDMTAMFSKCYSLKSVDFSSFDTRNVTSMGSMFFDAGLANIDLSSFDTQNVTNMSRMFLYTNNLKNVNGNFDVSYVTDYENFMDSRDTFNGEPWKKLFQ